MRDASVTKRNILQAAEEEFSAKGLYGTRIDEIASRAGVNKRMIYEYFGNKTELYRTVLQNAYERLGEQELSALAEEGSCVEAIRRMIRFYFDYLRANPTYVNLLLWENLNQGRYLDSEDTSSLRAPAFRALRSIVERGQKEGVFREEIDSEQVLISLLMYTFSHFSNRFTLPRLLGYETEEPIMAEKAVENLTEMILRYMCANGGNDA